MKKYLPLLATLVLFAAAIALLVSVFGRGEAQDSENTPAARAEVTNPAYIADPSAYTVDYDDRVSSEIPLDVPLWVEDIVDERTILVSYPFVQADVQIMELEELVIPHLGDSRGTRPESLWRNSDEGQCWASGMQSALRSNLWRRTVFLTRENDARQLELYTLVDGQSEGEYRNVTAMLIGSGYGSPSSSLTHLTDLEEVAALQKKGLWGECGV